jgi:hypothetical protein
VVKTGAALKMNSLDLFSIQALMQTMEQIHSKYTDQKLTRSDRMNRKRRTFPIIFLLSLTVYFPLVVRAVDASGTPPAASSLQAGDLIWPKKPGAIVPYNSRPGEAGESDATRWRKEKEAYLNQVRSEPSPSPQEKERYSALQ